MAVISVLAMKTLGAAVLFTTSIIGGAIVLVLLVNLGMWLITSD